MHQNKADHSNTMIENKVADEPTQFRLQRARRPTRSLIERVSAIDWTSEGAVLSQSQWQLLVLTGLLSRRRFTDVSVRRTSLGRLARRFAPLTR